MKPTKDIHSLIEIMAALRDKNTGCPWDIEQDFQSILPYTIEEVYEVADAIKRNDKIDLCDELGDLLLQVVYYAQMASEEGSFTFDDVVFAITSKMIRRHPHVFEKQGNNNKEAIKNQWERIKHLEKQQRLLRRMEEGLKDDSDDSFLGKVKTALPPQKQALALQNKAAEIGFDWQTPKPILEKITEEIAELQMAIEQKEKQQILQEFGDIYFTMINLARRLEIDMDEALLMTNEKFRQRFKYIENSLNAKNKSLQDSTLEEMEKLWQDSKNNN